MRRSLGSLEERLMTLLWQREPMSVRDAAKALGGKLAYTTVMTTLDRLFKKKLLQREKTGNAFIYQPAMTRDEYNQLIVGETLGDLLEQSTEPVLAAFVDAAAKVDDRNLLRLERLIAKHRKKNS